MFVDAISNFLEKHKQQYFCRTNDVQKNNILGGSDWVSVAMSMFFKNELILCSSPHLRFAATASAALPPRKADLPSSSNIQLLRPRHRLYDQLDLEVNIKKSAWKLLPETCPNEHRQPLSTCNNCIACARAPKGGWVGRKSLGQSSWDSKTRGKIQKKLGWAAGSDPRNTNAAHL